MEKSTRTIVITGASSGAGRAMALEFAKNNDSYLMTGISLDSIWCFFQNKFS